MHDPAELWADAVPLRDAWWILGDPWNKEKYRNVDSRGALETYRILLQDDLIIRIYHGELTAFGIQTVPSIGNGPEIIPKFVFAQPNVDWEKSTLRGYGRTYEGVRVVMPNVPVDIGSPVPTQPRRKGRPSVEAELGQVVRELMEAGELDGIPQKERENRVRSRAQSLYPRIFPAPRPSRATILKALKNIRF